MLIIGKILEENQIYLIMILKFYVTNGKVAHLYVDMMKVVFTKQPVLIVMAGKKWNFTL
jgi:hypothetical protein